jgi:hypothetical protein
MSHSPVDSAIKVTPAMEQQIAAAQTSDEVTAIFRQAMLDQNLIRKDRYNPDVVYEMPRAHARTKTVAIGGKNYVIEGLNETELLQKEADVWRSAGATAAAAPVVAQQQPRDPAGKFVPTAVKLPAQQQADDAAEALAQNDLQMKFRTGSISTDEYLAQSGAIERHLASKGIDVDALQEVSNKAFADRWEAGTEAFKKRHPEFEILRSEENRDVLGNIIAENGWIDRDPAEALEAAYAIAVEKNSLGETPLVGYDREMRAAKTPADIAEITAKYYPDSRGGRERSGLFDRG